MINKLYKLREYIPQEYIDESPCGLVLDERSETVIVMDFSTVELSDSPDEKSEKEPKYTFHFNGCHLEKFSRRKNETQFYFKQVKARGTSEFPTVFLSYREITENEWYFSKEKKRGKLVKILGKYSKDGFFQGLLDFMEAHSETISAAIAEKMQGRKNDDELYILTLKMDGHYIGDSPRFEKIRRDAEDNLLSAYYTLQSKKIRRNNKFCSVCLMPDREVWGYVSTFNFYTSKTEFAPIAGGFDKGAAWKNYPVCPECAVKLKESRAVINKYMRYYFCGFSYFLIPEFINPHEDNSEIMDIFLEPGSEAGKFSLGDDTRNTLTKTEGDILDILQDADNRVNYTLFFFEENNSEFKVLLTVEDVYPSQFKTIFDAKESAENHAVFKNLENKKEKTLYDLKFRFEFVKEFIPLSQDKTLGNLQVFKKPFLDITRAVFLGKRLDSGFIMHRIAESLRRKFANEVLYDISVLKMILTLKFFNRLGVIDLSSKHDEKEIVLDKKYQIFFDAHSDFFDCSSKKAVFLEGVLCQKLLNIQYKERNATPFRKKLNGLKMNPKVIRRLFPEIIEKLEQYRKNYYRDLEAAISHLFLASKLEKLSNDELSFYFVMGMNLSREFGGAEEKDDAESGK